LAKANFLALAAMMALASAQHAAARPITYPDGDMGMVEHEAGQTRTHVVHTFTPRVAAGIEFERDEDTGAEMVSLMGATLLARRNREDSQANAYLIADIGMVNQPGEKDRARLDLMLEADWETRRLYTAYRGEGRYIDGGETDLDHRLRFGVAPYIGDYGDLHIWAILQGDWREQGDERFAITPVIRAFKGRVLAEAGAEIETGRPFFTLWVYF
jgi:hypothetical protein